jgi:hypothetical protein
MEPSVDTRPVHLGGVVHRLVLGVVVMATTTVSAGVGAPAAGALPEPGPTPINGAPVIVTSRTDGSIPLPPAYAGLGMMGVMTPIGATP